MEITVTPKQKLFIDANADEVLFGGAAGGGKSYAQIIDALIYAVKYPQSKQLILRRTYPELDKSIIRSCLALYPKSIFAHPVATWTLSVSEKHIPICCQQSHRCICKRQRNRLWLLRQRKRCVQISVS